MLTNLKWTIYARKSSESAERQIQSIPDQLKIFNDIASKAGLKIIETITDEKSAKKPGKRVGFSRMIKRIEKGEINAILCWRLNRLARNPEEGGKIAQLLQNGTIKCIKTNEREYDPNYNMLLLAVELGMATEESRELAKGVERGCSSKAEDGWYPSNAPIGYKNSKWGKRGTERILTDKIRFPLVRKMWDLMLTGNYTPASIYYKAISEWNLTSPKKGKRGGNLYSLSSLYHMFKNDFYTGIFRYRGKTYMGKHQQMITVAEFDRVQYLLGRKSLPKAIKHDFPYTGIMKCASCGASITASEKTKRLKNGGIRKYTYYHCSRRISNTFCKARPITLGDFEEQIKNYLRTYTIGEEFFDLGKNILETAFDNRIQAQKAITTQHQDNIRLLERKREKLVTFLMNETISENEYIYLKQEIEQQLILGQLKLEQVNEDIEAQTETVKNGLHFSKKALSTFENANAETKRTILNHLGSNHTLNDKKLCITTPKWLLAIKQGENSFFNEKHRLELEKSLLNKGQNSFENFFPMVCATLENVRTILGENPKTTVPDLTKHIATSTEI